MQDIKGIVVMLTLEDCIEICGLSRKEVAYFVEHEHISDLKAAELVERYVVVDDTQTPHLRPDIVADIDRLNQQKKFRDARALEDFIRDFVLSHPNLDHLLQANE